MISPEERLPDLDRFERVGHGDGAAGCYASSDEGAENIVRLQRSRRRGCLNDMPCRCRHNAGLCLFTRQSCSAPPSYRLNWIWAALDGLHKHQDCGCNLTSSFKFSKNLVGGCNEKSATGFWILKTDGV